MKTFIKEYARIKNTTTVEVALYIERFATKQLRLETIKILFEQTSFNLSDTAAKEVEEFLKSGSDFSIKLTVS